MYEYLAKVFELDTTVDNELLISDISAGVGKVSVIANDTTQEQESALAEQDLNDEQVEIPVVLEEDNQ